MAVESSFEAMLFQNLKLDEPWLELRPWESIPSESGRVPASATETSSDCRDSVYRPSSLPEESLVRLVMNALQGGRSDLTSIQELSASFCAIPADRSGLRVPSLWNRSFSTSALGEILKVIGYSGYLVFLLQEFLAYFIGLSYGGNANGDDRPSFSLVNHAFAIAVVKALDGYICELNTVTAAACLRRSMGNADELLNDSSKLGCLTSIVHSEVTVLEVYRITVGLGGLGSGPELCVWSLLALGCGTLVSADSTGSVQFWDSHHGTLLQAHTLHKGHVNALATVPQHKRVFSVGSDGQVILYKLSSTNSGSNDDRKPHSEVIMGFGWTDGFDGLDRMYRERKAMAYGIRLSSD